MQTLRKIDCIMYRVTDLQKSVQIYEKLGMKKRWEDTERHMIGFTFPESDSEIVIHTNPDIPKLDFCYSVENVETMCKEWKENGYSILMEPIQVRTGKYAILEDFDKNHIPIIDLTSFNNKPQYDQ